MAVKTAASTEQRRVWHAWPALGPDWRGCVATMGVFDGFHRGHVELVHRARRHSARLGLPVVLVTFDPHPLLVTCPDRAPRQLLSVEARVEHALTLGVDTVVVLPFTRRLAATSAEDFVAQGLVGSLGVRALVVGENFRCGHRGAGDVDYLRAAGAWHGFQVDAVGMLTVGDQTCSSTAVRRCLVDGDVRGAHQLLGREDPRIG